MTEPVPASGTAANPVPGDDVRPTADSTGTRAPRTLGVFAHPDDETLSGGAILATMATHGPVTLVTANRGEHGEVIGPELAHLEGDHDALGAHRAQEIAGAVRALGVSEHYFLDQLPGLKGLVPQRITDSGMQWPDGATGVRAEPADDIRDDAFSKVDTELTARLLAGLIRRTRPDLVLTEEPDGGYGHPDHVQANRVTMRAVQLAADDELASLGEDDPAVSLPPWRVPVVAWVVRPAERVRPALAWLTSHDGRAQVSEHTGGPLRVLDDHQELPTIVRPQSEIQVDIPLTGRVLEGLRTAMRSHRTQIQAVHVDPALVPASGGNAAGWFGLSNDLLQPVPARATAMLAPGWGTAADLQALLAGEAPSSAGRDEPTWYARVMLGLCVLMGVLVAMVGTVFHRWQVPFGLLIAVFTLFSAGVLTRTLADRRGQVSFAVAVCVVVMVMTYLGGSDVLVTGQPVGVAWLVAAPVAAFAAALIPKRWFRD